MVFASVPAYFDPHNWNQQQQQQQAGGSGGGDDGGAHHQELPTPVPPRPEGGGGGGFTAAAIRPGSMAERARLAKIPQPEAALKCPRCDSTNTKFCYFNNYSLSQPRHFCKTCRRYWTRGGALRNVPVGGGCRRNKRTRSGGGSSRSSASNADGLARTSSAGGVLPAGGVGATATSHIPAQSALQFPFLSSLHQAPDYGATSTTTGLNYGGLQTINVDGAGAVDYHLQVEQWRLQQLQQLPFFAGLEQQTTPSPELGLYQFDGTAASFAGQAHGKASATAAGLLTQLDSVKTEEDQQLHGLSFSRQGLGIPGNSDRYWSGSLGGCGGNGARSTTAAAGTDGWTIAASTTGTGLSVLSTTTAATATTTTIGNLL